MNIIHLRLIELKQWLTGYRRRQRRVREARRAEVEALCMAADAPPIGGGEGPVVSLTSYGHRLGVVHCAIETIAQQTLPPQRVILWLTEDESTDDNPFLKRQMERGLEVRRCEDLRSFMKLIPTLRLLGLDNRPPIVTIDDDIMYQPTLLQSLHDTAKAFPGAVVCPRTQWITREDTGLHWPKVTDCPEPRPDILATGVGGAYYPAGCFTEEVLRADRFMELTPRADDLWFWGMERLAGTLVMKSPSVSPINEDYIDVDMGRKRGLVINNVYFGGNHRQLMALLRAYPQIDESIDQWLKKKTTSTT